MLHEILLSLSGFRSPIWDQINQEDKAESQNGLSSQAYTSPPERAMLNVLAELADLHIKVRESTAIASRSHPSPVCRAVSNRISTKHLRAFTQKVIHVEGSILQDDAQFVGAYKTVPLSTLLTEFQPWTRLLKWLWRVAQMLDKQDIKEPSSYMTGAGISQLLQGEGHTGYTDLKAMSNDLLVTAQQSWIQNLMPWVLYGQLPSYGAADFMIQPTWTLQYDLVPYFVSNDAAEAVLAIGKALNQVKAQRGLTRGLGSHNVCNMLMPSSLDSIRSLEYPLQSSAFLDVVNSINDTISEIALSKLLPANLILEFLLVVQEYTLLRNGEFSTSLLKQAAEHLNTHSTTSHTNKPVRKLGRIDNLHINDVEAAAILSKTWSELAALAPEHEFENPTFEKANVWLRLKTRTNPMPISTLLPVASSLCIELPPESPLHVFVTPSDIASYQDLNAYFISINRAEAQLTGLWRSASHRRCHPTPLGPPRSATRQGQAALNTQRERGEKRDRRMRSHWACVSQALFVLAEIGNYFHGEVIQNSWEHLRAWLDIDISSHPPSSKITSRSTTACSKRPTSHASENVAEPLRRSLEMPSRKTDPRTIARAHQKYLQTLYRSVLLDNSGYISVFRDLLNTIDHYVALFHRLQGVWRGLDLQEDENIVSAFANLPQEEEELMAEMKRTNTAMKDQLHELVDSIKEVEKERSLADIGVGTARIQLGAGTGRNDGEFVPWRAKTLDRLLMKLDFLAENKEEKFEDALVNVYEDE